jgi:subtilisin family serine protease
MQRCGVAVIDSGVNPKHPHVGHVVAGRSFIPGEPEAVYLDFLGHGTAVAAAICEKAPEASLFIARVFHRRLVTSIDVLLAALDWCLEQPVAFINLSLGTANQQHEPAFRERAERAIQADIRIVAPAGTLPGTLDGVIGVTMDDSVERMQLGANYSACGWPRPIPGQPQERNLHGVSFAVANVTGCLAREWMLSRQEDEDQLRR